MKRFALAFILLAAASLACGQQTALPTEQAAEQPTAARTADAAAAKLPTAHIQQDGNYRMMQVIGDLNVRPCAGTTCGVSRVAHDGEVLRVYGIPVVTDNMELWIRVDGGWVDPNYLKAVTK